MTDNGGLVDRKGWRRKLVVARKSKVEAWTSNHLVSSLILRFVARFPSQSHLLISFLLLRIHPNPIVWIMHSWEKYDAPFQLQEMRVAANTAVWGSLMSAITPVNRKWKQDLEVKGGATRKRIDYYQETLGSKMLYNQRIKLVKLESYWIRRL